MPNGFMTSAGGRAYAGSTQGAASTKMRCTTEVHGRVVPMDDHGVISQAESDEEILTFDVSDEALERTASTEQQAFTWIYCTGAWQYCPA